VRRGPVRGKADTPRARPAAKHRSTAGPEQATRAALPVQPQPPGGTRRPFSDILVDLKLPQVEKPFRLISGRDKPCHSLLGFGSIRQVLQHPLQDLRPRWQPMAIGAKRTRFRGVPSSQAFSMRMASQTASVTSCVVAFPPTSGVKTPSAQTFSTARIRRPAAFGSPRCSSI